MAKNTVFPLPNDKATYCARGYNLTSFRRLALDCELDRSRVSNRAKVGHIPFLLVAAYRAQASTHGGMEAHQPCNWLAIAKSIR